MGDINVFSGPMKCREKYAYYERNNNINNDVNNQNEKNNMSLDPFREDNNKDEINQNNQSNISKAAEISWS